MTRDKGQATPSQWGEAELRTELHSLVERATDAGVDPMNSVALLREVATALLITEGLQQRATHLDVLDTTCRPLSDK